MLLPTDVNPKECIYYNGAVVLEELERSPGLLIMDLYGKLSASTGMTLSLFFLCLDWLYLIDAAVVDERGIVVRCS
jgi:hypothetical protein